MIGIFKVNSDIFEIVDKRGEDMIKKKKIILFIGIVLFIILSIYMYFFVFSTKELKVKQIDIEDSSYVIENINEDEEFEIYTNDMSYFITDINGKELNTKKRLENHILTITPENGYQKNVIYKLALKQGDSFVDKNLKNIKCIYFSLNNKKMIQNEFDYEISKVNLKKEYTLKNKQLILDNIEIKLRIEDLNKEVVIKPKKYRLFLDDKEQSKILKPSKGKHIIKIQFQYNKKNYEYSQQVDIKEVPIEQLAKSIYKKSLGNNIIVVDINEDGIPEAITQNEYVEEFTYKTKVNIYSIENEKMYRVCSKTVYLLESIKLLKNNQLYLQGHVASDISDIHILKFEIKNNKLRLVKSFDGEIGEDHSLDFNNPNYSSYYINGNQYTKKEFFKKYVVRKNLNRK